MDKVADAQYPIHELLTKRWSPRAFAERPVEQEKLQSLLEAARWAPSSYNEQPWSFFVASQDEGKPFSDLVGCLVEGNVPWARNAPVLMLSVAKLRFEKNQKENRHAQHDVGLATANLVLQATALELVVHQMAGFDPEKARNVLQIPEGYQPLTMIAIGYQGDAEQLPEPYREREKQPRSRKPMSEFVFSGKWGETSSV